MRYPLNPIRIVYLVFLVLLARHAHADTFIIDTTESLLGFVNHKRGLAKMFVEDPLSYPTAYTMDIELDPSLESGGFRIHYYVKDVQVADGEMLRRWGDAILAAGATATPLRPSSPSRQERIRKVIVSKRVLHASKYPEIEVRSLGVKKLTSATTSHTHEINIEILLHGEAVKTVFLATVTLIGDRVTIDGAFPLKMTDFNIKPYSTLFGAIRFDDVFHVYLHLEADRKQ